MNSSNDFAGRLGRVRCQLQRRATWNRRHDPPADDCVGSERLLRQRVWTNGEPSTTSNGKTYQSFNDIVSCVWGPCGAPYAQKSVMSPFLSRLKSLRL